MLGGATGAAGDRLGAAPRPGRQRAGAHRLDQVGEAGMPVGGKFVAVAWRDQHDRAGR